MPAATTLQDVRTVVDHLLLQAAQQRASDIHIEPAAPTYEVKFRIDGLLEIHQRVDPAVGRALVARLMVMAKLLTYRLDVPQEGRLSFVLPADQTIDLRLSVMPTIHGLRAVVRMPADQVQPALLEELGLPQEVRRGLLHFAAADSGMLILTGPAGSGKTTTIYALLRHIQAHQPGLSIITLEDPVERQLAGITQIEVSPFGQLSYERALRSILRQDPQVLLLGEIRDAATASLAVQAALSGHRLITTLHAASAAGALARLLEMGIESYQIASSVFGIVNQRLARRLAPGGSYRGRVPLAQWMQVDSAVKNAILGHAGADDLEAAYRSQAAYRAMADVAKSLIDQKITDIQEIARAMGQNEGG